jgi:hypothetical protein
LLKHSKIAFEHKTTDHYFIPSKNSTIVYKKANSEFKIKGEKEIWVWEDLWINRKKIVINKIFGHLGLLKSLPARVCKVSRIDKKTAEDFLQENHLQGYVSSKLKYGLYLGINYQRLIFDHVPAEGLLVAVMTYSGKRMFRDGSKSYEMTRFGGLKNLRVVGGFTKMLKFFLKEIDADHIMTYIDRDWSEGDGLGKFGFEKTGVLDAMFFDLDEKNERVKVDKLQKYKVYNAGSLKMEWKKR